MDRDDEVYVFEEMVKAQKFAANKNWEGLKKISMKPGNEEMLVDPSFDLVGNTAIHAVARSSANAQVLKDLLEIIPTKNQKGVLKISNKDGNTVLHETVFRDKDSDLEKVNVIMNFATEHHEEEEGPEDLLQLKNFKRETPVYRAAKYGNLKWLQHVHANHFSLKRHEHFPRNEPGTFSRPILHSCLLRFHYDVAIWLVEEVDENYLLEQTYGIIMQDDKGVNHKHKGFTCFQVLAKMMAFKSTDTEEMGRRKNLIYELLPEKGHKSELGWDDDDAGNNSERDIENLQVDNIQMSTFSSLKYYAVWKWLPLKAFSKLKYYAVWKWLAEKVPFIGEIWHRKKQHMLAMRLVELIVERKNTKASWKEYSYTTSNKELRLIPDFPSNVTEKKKQVELNDRVRMKDKIKQKISIEKRKAEEEEEEERKKDQAEQSKTKKIDEVKEDIISKWETPLFIAAACGITEVVEIIVGKYPEAISHVNEDGLNILHMAIKHRQEKVYEFLEGCPAFKALTPRISNDGRTILHRAASMEYYRELALPGVADQLMHELQWYYRVRSQVPKQFLMHCDENNLTAGDLLDIEHADMHDQAKVWMKETAQSCSTVAVLIASVVFAAAYALPGGTENGSPVLHQTTAFKIFTIMDIVALAGSLGSVVMFLSILTSSFDLWDFHVTLPRKLKVGFIMLFFSLITTMMAFTSTIVLTIRMEGNKKTTTFIYSLAFCLVSVFGLTQFPLYAVLNDMFITCVEFARKVFRRRKDLAGLDLLD